MSIPFTRVRLKAYINLRATNVFLDPSGDITAQILALKKEDYITIGAAQRLLIEQNRDENQYYRQFATNLAAPEQAAKPAETYPGLISFRVELERVDLHDANLFEAFRIAGAGTVRNIVSQVKPILLVVTQFTPGTPTDHVTIQDSPTGAPARDFVGESRVIYVPGCWINKFPVEFSVTDTNQAYIASVEMVAQDVI